MFKTLLVENNLDYRAVLKRALLKRFDDLDTRESSGERDTLEAVNSYDPDLVIMDVDLDQDANGLDLTKKIKGEHPEIIVAILSQHDIPEYRAVAEENGADFFISKVSSLESVFDYVDSIIERKRNHH